MHIIFVVAGRMLALGQCHAEFHGVLSPGLYPYNTFCQRSLPYTVSFCSLTLSIFLSSLYRVLRPTETNRVSRSFTYKFLVHTTSPTPSHLTIRKIAVLTPIKICLTCASPRQAFITSYCKSPGKMQSILS